MNRPPRIHTDIAGWASQTRQDIKDNKFLGTMRSLRGIQNGLLFTLTTRYPLGTNIFERDWDLMIILDACRVDAMREVAPEYDFIHSVGAIWSVGSSSHEWLCNTFKIEYSDIIRDTIVVSTNPNVPRIFKDKQYLPPSYSIPVMFPKWDIAEEADFRLLRQLHQHEQKEYYSPPPPEVVTDHVIRLGRDHDFERMVAHYFQPHRPYISGSYREDRPLTSVEREPWSAIQNGTATKEDVWELYLDNLRLALDSVERLLENIDVGKVVISADHGDLFGEWGAYGHPEGFLHPNLRKVPWVKTTATDTEGEEPLIDAQEQDADFNYEEQLRELGYL